jgi:ABC-type branched-subunit amino acid transport system permease subunit
VIPVTVLLVVACVAMPVVMALCANGRIRLNHAVGIRIPPVTDSEDSWRRGHRAAVVPSTVFAVVSAAVLVLVLVVPALRLDGIWLALGSLLIGLGWATFAAVRAAR